MTISVLILTLNEERNLPACLASLDWCDDIVVLDSFSTDRTVEIARAAGARVHERRFDDERRQRMYGLRELTYHHPWLYMPDADEITTVELRDEMLAVVAASGPAMAAYRIRPMTMFMGHFIRHSSLYPTWTLRLFRPDRVEFEREIHLRAKVEGGVSRLKAHYLHYSFNNGFTAWFDKHNRYSTAEAREALINLSTGSLRWRDLLPWADPVRRRAALKDLSFRIPFRPAARFTYMYLLRGGFRDGWPGYVYCRLLAAYEYMIVVKMAEARRRDQNLPI
jgi:glycosyltransferase involved in cell wall biosynthesis